MTEYDKLSQVAKELKKLAIELDIKIITAVQPYFPGRRSNPVELERNDFIFIDYMGILK